MKLGIILSRKFTNFDTNIEIKFSNNSNPDEGEKDFNVTKGRLK